MIRWMEEILHQLVPVDGLSVYPTLIPLFTVFHSYPIVANWCRIPSIYSIDQYL